MSSIQYETIILEMLSRIQVLEKKVEQLESQRYVSTVPEGIPRITTIDIQNYIEKLKDEAANGGEQFLQIVARDIHREFQLKDKFPVVCNAMRKCMRPGDVVVHETPSGQSSTLEIRYYLTDTLESEVENV